jgi:hypothetical protein
MMKEKMMNMRKHDRDYELVAAALLGAAVGVFATILLRQSASGRRPILTGLQLAGRGVQKAGKAGLLGAAATSRTIARNARRGAEMVEEIPFGDIADHVRDYFDAAKGAVEDTISDELHDLKKSLRRRRRRLGI